MRALIAAAGRGSRAGLALPKTLYPVQGVPILVRICNLLQLYDQQPTVIVSPTGEMDIRECLTSFERSCILVVQPDAKGMGDAVLRFSDSPAFAEAENTLLIWGDVPFIQPDTLADLVTAHEADGNDFTFVTRVVERPYTLVSRDSAGKVVALIETREMGIAPPEQGERDIGLFMFRTAPVMELLKKELPGKLGKATGEHGFLYIVTHLVEQGFKVAAIPTAKHIETISLNRMEDLDGYL